MLEQIAFFFHTFLFICLNAKSTVHEILYGVKKKKAKGMGKN